MGAMYENYKKKKSPTAISFVVLIKIYLQIFQYIGLSQISLYIRQARTWFNTLHCPFNEPPKLAYILCKIKSNVLYYLFVRIDKSTLQMLCLSYTQKIDASKFLHKIWTYYCKHTTANFCDVQTTLIPKVKHPNNNNQ